MLVSCFTMSLATAARLFNRTPLLKFNRALLQSLDSPEMPEVLLKMESMQKSGSFKDRGISNMVQTLYHEKLSEGITLKKIICSSGGNAGHAVATIGSSLNIPVDVFVPETTMPMMIDKIKATSSNTNVIIHGENWNAADQLARETLVKYGDESIYVPPYDDPLIWDGNSSIVDEIYEELCHPESFTQGEFPDCIILSVGGGGLLRGVQIGVEKLIDAQKISTKTCIFAVETEGTAGFALARKDGKGSKLDAITSIASSLGALSVVPDTVDSAVSTESVVVSDKEALDACFSFADNMRTLVEPACGAALSLMYSDKGKALLGNNDFKNVLFVVCGGSAISLDLLEKYKQKVN